MDGERVIHSGKAGRTPIWRRWVLGAVVLIACVAIAVLPLLHRAYPRLLIRTCFTDAQGLREGAEVRFAGVHVGFVRSIRAQPYNKQCPADVEMAIGPGYEVKIPRDAEVLVETAGVLGATFLDIDARAASGPPITNHGVLNSRSVPTLSTEEMIRMLAKSLGRCPCNERETQSPGTKELNAPQ